MELLLINDKPVSMNGQYSLPGSGECLVVSSKESFTLEPSALYYCKSLLNGAASVSAPLLNGTLGSRDKMFLSLPPDIQLSKDVACIYQNFRSPTLKLEALTPFPFISHTSTLRLCSGDEFKFLERIREQCGKDNVRINLKISQFNRNVIEAKGLPIINLCGDGNPCGYGCEIYCVKVHSLKDTCGRLTISMELTEDAFGGLFSEKFATSNLSAEKKRLLEDEAWSDLTIIAGNGTEIKCHKGMLAVHSDVFESMFENQMKEGITNVVEMSDMSEPAVRAFLGFIYYSNMKEASESSDIALELLVAADKYNISKLLSAIAELIEFMPIEWFNVEMSVELLTFTERQRWIGRNEQLELLQEKVIEILKEYTKDSADILLNSQAFQELLRNSPETAMQVESLIF